jgi:hypothetical protein
MGKKDIVIDRFPTGAPGLERVIGYYEKYRLLYNLLVGASGVIGLLLTGYSSQSLAVDLFLILLFGTMANIMFTMSWAGTILADRHLANLNLFFRYRMAILVFGTFFSMLVAFWTAVIFS